MRSTKSIILIVIALGCGLIASIGISQVMDSRSSAGAETEAIYVTTTNVQQWTKLNATVVKLEDWPKDKIPEGAARALEDFEGMSPRYPLYPGEPIVIGKLSDSLGGSASERIPDGYQVFAVKVDKESALSGLIYPGDKVDVLVFIRGRNGDDDGISTGTRTILHSVTVFAVNDQITRNTEEETTIDAKTVSLLVQPAHSERLLLAKQLGTIHLALRNPSDNTEITTEGARPGDLDKSDEANSGLLAGNTEPTPKPGLFDILKGMKGVDSTAVDSSNAMDLDQLGSTMVIMSPDGVLARYSFPLSGTNGIPQQLPSELLGGYRRSFTERGGNTNSVTTGDATDVDSNQKSADDDDPQGEKGTG